ncbi:MAG: hypothetical protein ABIN67_04390 [Ferruginibacter sp.]
MTIELNKKKYNILFSLILLALLASIIIFIFYPGRSASGAKFNVWVVFILARYIALYIGIAVILLRALRILKDNSVLIYIFTGSLNICLGVICLVSFIPHNTPSSFLNLFIINDVIGAIIFMDTMVFDFKKKIKAN